MKDLTLIYEGSVKKVWKPFPDQGDLFFAYTDDYSVFDWGKMPDTIKNKGTALVALAAYFFEHLQDASFWAALPKSPHWRHLDSHWLAERFAHPLFARLCKSGLESHYLGLADGAGMPVALKQLPAHTGALYLHVMEAQVRRPEPFVLMGQTVYHYADTRSLEGLRLVPLEVVFRFGMPAGSSLKARLQADPLYAHKIALGHVPEEGKLFDRVVLELFTKLEDKDRLLSVQEALIVSGLTPERFEELTELSFLIALALFAIFAEKGVELWDGKFEFVTDGKKLLLADSIGPDELRLIYRDTHLSKELIRQFYRGSNWERSIKEAQLIASSRASLDWRDVCRKKLGQEPEHLQSDFKRVVDHLYGVIANHMLVTTPAERTYQLEHPVFREHPSLDDFIKEVRGTAAVLS